MLAICSGKHGAIPEFYGKMLILSFAGTSRLFIYLGKMLILLPGGVMNMQEEPTVLHLRQGRNHSARNALFCPRG